MRKLVFINLLLTINLAFSQIKEATILFKDNTSIEGFGEIKKNKIYFKIEEKEEPSEWSFDMAKGITFSSYGYSEKYEYVTVSKKKKPLLLQVIEEGNVSLYLDVFIETTYGAFATYNFNKNFNPTATPKNNLIPQVFSDDAEMQRVYYTKRNSEEIATSITTSFSKTATKYFEDCGVLVQKIKTGKFLKKDIEEIVTYYNNYCYDDENETDKDASH
jgi:hypothetical protein